MGYTKLVFQASAWLEVYDPKTGTMVLKAEAAGVAEDVLCELQVEPIPGTDPVQYLYSCLSINCGGICKLRKRITPVGTQYWCECQPGLAAAKAGKPGAKASTKAKKKPAAKKAASRKK